MESFVQVRLYRTARLNSLTDAAVLRALCSDAAVERLEKVVEALSQRDRGNFLRGYRLAVATPLYGLLQFAVDFPELLGCASDEGVANWLHFGQRGRNASIISAVSDPESDLARLCSLFDKLIVSLRTADKDFDATAAALKDCESLTELVRAVAVGCNMVSLDTGEGVVDNDQLFSKCVAERVLDYVEYSRSLRVGALQLVWRGDEEPSPTEEATLEAETSLGVPFSWSWGEDVPQRWGNGFLYGLDLAIRMNDVALSSHSRSGGGTTVGSDWFDELLRFVNPTHPEPSFPSLGYGISEFSTVTAGSMISKLPLTSRVISSADRLKAIWGPDTVRLATSQGATDTLDLEIMLAGAVSVHAESPVPVLFVTHSVAQDYRDWVSIAVRLPRYGLFSNASQWHLFYKVYHDGYIDDADVGRALGKVEELLLKFEGALHVRKIDGLTDEDLLQHCELPAFRAMRDLSHRAVEVNKELRAGNSELMSAFWMQNNGYNWVRASFKRAALGDFEYDAIGIRGKECLVVEVKGGEVIDSELQEEIIKFAGKVEHLRGRLPAVGQALGYDGRMDGISGMFISLADLEDFEPTEQSVALWDYDRFVRELGKAGLPNRLVRLLHKEYIIRQLDDDLLR